MSVAQPTAWQGDSPLIPATRPTMYFYGVTTHQSSIMKVFPHWADYLGLGDVALQGVNFQRHDRPEAYRRHVQFLLDDPLSLGALVTTHKLDVVSAARDLFSELDEFGELLQEVSSIAKRQGRLVGHAKDAITGGLALEAFLPPHYWQDNDAEVLVLGAGGSAVAITWYLVQRHHGANRPRRIHVTNHRQPRLDELARFHRAIEADVPIEYHCTPTPEHADAILGRLPPGSVIMNATGLGKDAPGSPLTDNAHWPQRAIAWDFNYRGDLRFLDQARRQQAERHITIVDGWVYFILGWTQVMAEVFERPIPPRGPEFDELSAIAARYR